MAPKSMPNTWFIGRLMLIKSQTASRSFKPFLRVHPCNQHRL